MTRAYNVVDADGHILEPLDLWDCYMDPAFRDRAPRVVKDNETGKERLIIEEHTSDARLSIGRVGARQGIVVPTRFLPQRCAVPITAGSPIIAVPTLTGCSA